MDFYHWIDNLVEKESDTLLFACFPAAVVYPAVLAGFFTRCMLPLCITNVLSNAITCFLLGIH